MNIKRGLISCILFFFICINFIISQDSLSENIPQIPGSDYLGEFDPETGTPKKLNDFQGKVEDIKSREQNKSFLFQEWTKVLVNNKFFGPFLFYTDKFFSLFNPLWRYSFGMEFAWSFAFFLHIFIWVVLVLIIYFPAREIFKNTLIGFFIGVVVASITGSFEIITRVVEIFDVMFNKLWAVTVVFIVIILLIVLYAKIFEKFRKESGEEELKRAQENVKAHGQASERALGEFQR